MVVPLSSQLHNLRTTGTLVKTLVPEDHKFSNALQRLMGFSIVDALLMM